MEIILPNKPGKHNYKQKYDLKKRHCLDLNQGSPVNYTGALTAKPQHHVSFVDNRWKSFKTNKLDEHNYKQKNDMKMRHCLDLNQGSPVY